MPLCWTYQGPALNNMYFGAEYSFPIPPDSGEHCNEEGEVLWVVGGENVPSILLFELQIIGALWHMRGNDSYRFRI